MTVIAYKDGYMAADSLLCDVDDGTIFGEIDKIRRLDDGALLGIAGDVRECERFITWYNNGDSPLSWETTEDHFEILLVNANGAIDYYDGTITPMRIYGEHIAIGSGSQFALAMMSTGANAEIAVTRTIEYNIFCGGTIKVEKLGDE